MVTNQPKQNRDHIALATMLKPEYWDMDPFDYVDITPKMRFEASRSQLEPSLVDVPNGSPLAVSYWPGGASRPGNIAVTPHEYTVLVRSRPETFSRSARARTLQVRPTGDEHDQAAERAVVHAHESKFAAQQGYLNETLVPWNRLLGRFEQAAEHPGLSLMGKEETMRAKFEELRYGVFENMFEALRRQRGWSDQQMDFARRTVEARMFIDRDHNRHLRYFAGFVAMSQYYFGHKTALFRDRAYQSRRAMAQAGAHEG